jgi:hypothetical protein
VISASRVDAARAVIETSNRPTLAVIGPDVSLDSDARDALVGAGGHLFFAPPGYDRMGDAARKNAIASALSSNMGSTPQQEVTPRAWDTRDGVDLSNEELIELIRFHNQD